MSSLDGDHVLHSTTYWSWVVGDARCCTTISFSTGGAVLCPLKAVAALGHHSMNTYMFTYKGAECSSTHDVWRFPKGVQGQRFCPWKMFHKLIYELISWTGKTFGKQWLNKWNKEEKGTLLCPHQHQADNTLYLKSSWHKEQLPLTSFLWSDVTLAQVGSTKCCRYAAAAAHLKILHDAS